MLDHHLQRSIVYRLAQKPSLRFSELKPEIIDNKLFTYHLKKVITAGYVTKNSEGIYTLTPEGRRLGTRVLESPQALVDKADSVLFLIIRRKKDGAWLLYKRLTYPLLDRRGFMHCIPNSIEETTQTARRVCLERTGLNAEFKVLGGGYFRVYEKDNLESFTHFTLLVCDDARGELVGNDEHAEYFWETDPEFNSLTMLPNMQLLADLYTKNQTFFLEKTLNI